VRKLRRLPWRLPKQNAGADSAAPPPRRDNPVERPEPSQPVAYIAGRYVYSAEERRAMRARQQRTGLRLANGHAGGIGRGTHAKLVEKQTAVGRT